MTPNQIAGRNLRILRIRSGMTQLALADLLAVTHQQVQKYESGKNAIPAFTMLRLARHFSVHMESFFSEPATEHAELPDAVTDLLVFKLFKRITEPKAKRMAILMLRLLSKL